MMGHTTAHEDARPEPRSAERVLVVPGLDGDPRLLMAVAPRLYPGLRALPFDHLRDPAEDGLEGLAARALRVLDADPAGNAPAYVSGESFGGTIALTLARRYPDRVRGLILFSTFGWYPGVGAYASRLGMACWRLLGDRLAAPIFDLWRPVGVPGALGRRPPPAPPARLPGAPQAAPARLPRQVGERPGVRRASVARRGRLSDADRDWHP